MEKEGEEEEKESEKMVNDNILDNLEIEENNPQIESDKLRQ